MPQAVSTRGLTTPQPPHSIQPSPRQVRQAPRSHAAAHEADQVDLGRRLGEREVGRPEAGGDALAEQRGGKWSSVPLRWAMVMPLSTTRPSTWWNIGECVASYSSVRKTRPGQTT